MKSILMSVLSAFAVISCDQIRKPNPNTDSINIHTQPFKPLSDNELLLVGKWNFDRIETRPVSFQSDPAGFIKTDMANMEIGMKGDWIEFSRDRTLTNYIVGFSDTIAGFFMIDSCENTLCIHLQDENNNDIDVKQIQMKGLDTLAFGNGVADFYYIRTRR